MNLNIETTACFADSKGRPSKRVEKWSRKLLTKAAPVLERVMEPEERIVGVLTGCSPFSILELMTTGYIITVVKRCLLVVTDRRILHLPTRSGYVPRGSVSQMRFADIASGTVKGFLGKQMKLVYRDGTKEKFTSISGAAAKRLGAAFGQRAGQGEPTVRGARHFICPHCARALERDAVNCAQCGFEFRSRKKALRYSLAFPGGGYFYTGHPVMGVLDGFVEAFLLLLLIPSVGLAMAGEPGMWPTVALVAAAFGFEKLITVYHANHYVSEFLPVRARPVAASTRPS